MKNLKVSSKMRKSIERLEKKFGELEKTFGSELDSINIENDKFYCFCTLRCDILKSLAFTVSVDGSVHNC